MKLDFYIQNQLSNFIYKNNKKLLIHCGKITILIKEKEFNESLMQQSKNGFLFHCLILWLKCGLLGISWNLSNKIFKQALNKKLGWVYSGTWINTTKWSLWSQRICHFSSLPLWKYINRKLPMENILKFVIFLSTLTLLSKFINFFQSMLILCLELG